MEINRSVIRKIFLKKAGIFEKRVYRAGFELIWKDPRSKIKIDDISYGSQKSRNTF
jgi:hypothetical protein